MEVEILSVYYYYFPNFLNINHTFPMIPEEYVKIPLQIASQRRNNL
jgi:hypothetical protein